MKTKRITTIADGTAMNINGIVFVIDTSTPVTISGTVSCYYNGVVTVHNIEMITNRDGYNALCISIPPTRSQYVEIELNDSIPDVIYYMTVYSSGEVTA